MFLLVIATIIVLGSLSDSHLSDRNMVTLCLLTIYLQEGVSLLTKWKRGFKNVEESWLFFLQGPFRVVGLFWKQ